MLLLLPMMTVLHQLTDFKRDVMTIKINLLRNTFVQETSPPMPIPKQQIAAATEEW
jgi:hypothetical protein